MKTTTVDKKILDCLTKTPVHHPGTLSQATGYRLQTIIRHIRQLEMNGVIRKDENFLYIIGAENV